jgi:hypothetical protein
VVFPPAIDPLPYSGTPIARLSLKQMPKLFAICLAVITLLCYSASAEEKVPLAPFGILHVYPPQREPAENYLIVVSGDGGWVKTVVELGDIMSRHNSFVIGVDVSQYLHNSWKDAADCFSPSKDFRALTTFLRQNYGMPGNMRPVLIGYSSGATLVYATFVQTPQPTFRAAFSFGFCPDFSGKRPFCESQELKWSPTSKGKGVFFLPAHYLHKPWIVFQGLDDQVCNPEITRQFVKQVPSGEFVLLPRVGHGFANVRIWLPQFLSLLQSFQYQNRHAKL